jgi:hypothetical protein
MSSPRPEVIAEGVKLVSKVNDIILFPLIALLSAVAFLIFLYGCAQYIINANNEKAKGEGVKHITWGIVGLVVMLTAWSIMLLISSTFGLGDEQRCALDPSASGCADVFNLPAPPEKPKL